eukprot:s3937_g2.t1
MIWMNQVRTLQQPGGLPPDTRWIVVLEDDVYVNLARLYYFLAGHASKDQHPVMFTHAARHTKEPCDLPATSARFLEPRFSPTPRLSWSSQEQGEGQAERHGGALQVYDFDRPCLSAGTAILSRAAFELLAPHASCKTRAGLRAVGWAASLRFPVHDDGTARSCNRAW